MFHSHANPIIRLVFAPILLLFYLQYSGAPMPILGPIFVVILLTLMPSRPPFNMMVKILLSLFFISFGLVILGNLLINTPTGYSLFLFAILFWSYYRSHHDPKDILSTLTLIVVIVMTVMAKQLNASIDGLPYIMFEEFLIAIIVTMLSFVLFPGEEKDILPDEENNDTYEVDVKLVLLKAVAMWVVIMALIGIGGSQVMLIAITISNLIKIPNREGHKEFKYNRLVTTSIGILFTLPVMFLYSFGVPTWVLLGFTLFFGIQLACYAIRRQCRFSLYQLMFTNFTVLTYQIIKHEGILSLPAELMRLVSIVIAILVGGLIINLLSSEPPKLKSVADEQLDADASP
ncbi:DUF2955 domain-containing protein [Shewanella gaetbuli]|uniref:DUF2955 domain-containing protein n=1 Tax=Shewanella gaetbuli TaxID=220752 RepID=A0A9X1ZF31_9GAMM|nr:DUF2955 domain-containing protein [Shewanella gaetbuli]MCL1141194.1 DUF2955 domain-containing protein [Shewanella gaetbuli]